MYVKEHSCPSQAIVSRQPIDRDEDLAELVQRCKAGDVYEVERWIQARRPMQALLEVSGRRLGSGRSAAGVGADPHLVSLEDLFGTYRTRRFNKSITNVPSTPATTPVTTRSIVPPMPAHVIPS